MGDPIFVAMPYNRRAIRLPEFDYGAGHAYFVTLCTARRIRVLSAVLNAAATMTSLGAIVQDRWMALPLHHRFVTVDAHVVMPDHVHGIVHIDEGATAALPLVMAMFKGAVTRRARVAGVWGEESLWQRGYYEQVIRGPRHLDKVRQYIVANPYRWRG